MSVESVSMSSDGWKKQESKRVSLMIYYLRSGTPAHLRHCRDSPGETALTPASQPGYCTRQALASRPFMLTGRRGQSRTHKSARIIGYYDMNSHNTASAMPNRKSRYWIIQPSFEAGASLTDFGRCPILKGPEQGTPSAAETR